MQWTWTWANFGDSEVPGASVRNSTLGKGHEEGGSAYAKAGSSLRKPPVPEHLPPKPESVLCSHLYLWLYGGLSPIIVSLGGVNLQIQLIKIPGRDKSVSTYKLLWRFSSLPDRLVQPHVIVHGPPTVRGMRCFKLSKYRFFWEVRKLLVYYSGLIRNYIGEEFFICLASVCCQVSISPALIHINEHN